MSNFLSDPLGEETLAFVLVFFPNGQYLAFGRKESIYYIRIKMSSASVTDSAHIAAPWCVRI